MLMKNRAFQIRILPVYWEAHPLLKLVYLLAPIMLDWILSLRLLSIAVEIGSSP